MPYDPRIPEGQPQEKPFPALQAYLAFDVLLQSLDERFANAEQDARADNRKVIEALRFGEVKKIVREAVDEYVSSLPEDDETLPTWVEELQKLPEVIEYGVIFRVFVSPDPEDALYALELWVASLILNTTAAEALPVVRLPRPPSLYHFLTVVKSGWVPLAEAFARGPTVPDAKTYERAFLFAAQQGHLRMLQWVVAQEDYEPETWAYGRALLSAAERGNLRMVQWITQENPAAIDNTILQAFVAAAQNGRLRVIQWLAARSNLTRDADIIRAFFFAVKNGHLLVVQWLVREFPNVFEDGFYRFALENVYRVAVEQNRLAVVRWFLTQPRLPFDFPDIAKLLGKEENLPMMQLFVERGYVAAEEVAKMSPESIKTFVLALPDAQQIERAVGLVRELSKQYTTYPAPKQVLEAAEFLLRTNGPFLQSFLQWTNVTMQSLVALASDKGVQVQLRSLVTRALTEVLAKLRANLGGAQREQAEQTLAALTDALAR